MGKKDKEHKKKVLARNQRLKSEEASMKRLFTESMKTQIEEMKKKYEAESGTTQNQ